MVADGQLLMASLLFVTITLLLDDVVAVDDLTRHLRRRPHHQHQQQDFASRMLSHDVVSRCDDVCQLQQSVERLSAVQLDYGRALHAVYGLVDTVRRDVSAAR